MSIPTGTLTPARLQELLNGPAGTPPTGVLPKFDDPPSLKKYLVVTLVLCITVTSLSLFLRMYTKIFLIRSIAYEDYTIVIAWLGQIAEAIPSAICTRYGGGRHMWDVRLKSFFRLLYWVDTAGILYDITVALIKISILLQYLRIFVPAKIGNMAMFIAIQVCIWACLIFYAVSVAFEVAMCSPRQKIWNPLLPGHCFDNNATVLATGLFNVISDLAILLLPMPILWRLQIPLRDKLMTVAVFGTGSLACVASIIRTYYSWKIVQNEDWSYNMGIIGLWTYAEIAIGVSVSCLPGLPKFFRHYGPRMRSYLRLQVRSGSKSDSRLYFERLTLQSQSRSELPTSTKPRGSVDTGTLHTGQSITLNDSEDRSMEQIVSHDTNMPVKTAGSSLDETPLPRDDIEMGLGARP
ncbi:hypothetical protein ACLMJK_006459 [Lecanora helva]